MTVPADYVERVYAGVLGKIIGVYLGRPIEGWRHERIMRELGEVTGYVHERLGVPLVVTDDDISGTLTFVRALEDHGFDPMISPAKIGQTWLNYLIEGRTILWWGGMGNSTEHTAYLRLKHGVPAPRSGSIEENGAIVAEQIGAQIFIDGWAMVAPADPERAADLARRAASVSHDGEAVYAAQLLAAMESLAFVEPDIGKLLAAGLAVIPRGSTIFAMVNDVMEWHAADRDWRRSFARIDERYGYAKFRGGCHVMPNHGIIILGLLAGGGDFARTLAVVNSCGLDTDCNSGNAGCLMGIRGGLAGIEAAPGGPARPVDWRGPVADRIYIPTADCGRAITDAVREAYAIANTGLALAGAPAARPKRGARFHFEMPGSVQGFRIELGASPARLENVAGHSTTGSRSLAIRLAGGAPGRPVRASTATFIPPDGLAMGHYDLMASPTLYPTQVVEAGVAADASNGGTVSARLYIVVYGPDDAPETLRSPGVALEPGCTETLSWKVPDTGGLPICSIGLEVEPAAPSAATVYLDYLSWDGTPTVLLGPPSRGGTLWRRAWVNGADRFSGSAAGLQVIQDEGRGLLLQGGREWTDYEVSANVFSWLASSVGIAARVQGMRRYYALVLRREGQAQLVKMLDTETVLAETPFPWEPGTPRHFALSVHGSRIRGSIDDTAVMLVTDADRPLAGGAVALLCEEGFMSADTVRVEALAADEARTTRVMEGAKR